MNFSTEMVYAIVVTYNGHQWYERCFNSLLASEHPLHILVVDNSPNQETVDFLLEEFPEVEVVKTKENLGFGGANNLGLRKALEAGADYTFLVNQDAWIAPDATEKLIQRFKENPEYGILSPVHFQENEHEMDTLFKYYFIEGTKDKQERIDAALNAESKLYGVGFVNAALWLIKKGVLERVGGFNPIFHHYGEDDDYVHRAKYHGFAVGVVTEAKGVHARKQKPVYDSTNSTEVQNISGTGVSYKHLLQLITNINLSWPYILLVWQYLVIKNLLKSLMKMDFQAINNLFRTNWRLFKELPMLVANRQRIKKNDGVFLN